MLIFTTLKYHDRFNYHKKFMELENANFDIYPWTLRVLIKGLKV